VLLCAPSLGILDNWLPVLHAARASHPDWRIVALIPDRTTLAQLDPSDTAHVLADEVIDTTVAPLHGGGWVLVDGFLASQEAARPHRLLRRIRTPVQRRRRTAPSSLAGPHSRLLYDVHLHEKDRIRPLLEDLEGTPRLSHNHGVEIETLNHRRVKPPGAKNIRAAFLYGPSEIGAYAWNFGLERNILHPVGLVRHTPNWMQSVIQRSQSLHELPFDEFAFIVSRPAGSAFLPRDRKVAALRVLHEVLWEERGIPLVLRTHPKEHADGTLTMALPSKGEGVSWAVSRAHPFHLATRSLIGVTFLSGVAIDLVVAGVPVIEFLDTRGLEPHDSPYRRDGLVIPVEDASGLRSAVGVIRRDRHVAAMRLDRRVHELFEGPSDPMRLILALLAAE
jgi:hypothetical protein